jgi:hypothetical protein
LKLLKSRFFRRSSLLAGRRIPENNTTPSLLTDQRQVLSAHASIAVKRAGTGNEVGQRSRSVILTIMTANLNANRRPIVSMKVCTQSEVYACEKSSRPREMPPRTMPIWTRTIRTMALKPIVDCTGCVVNHSRQNEISVPELGTLTFPALYEANGLRRQGDVHACQHQRRFGWQAECSR